MSAYFRMGQVGPESDYIPRLGEVILHEMVGVSGEKNYRTVVGDGRTPVGDLPSLAAYDLNERVARLEREMERLKSDAPLELTPEDEGHYSCRFGDFYQIFANDNDSWEFKAKGILKEDELAEALEILRRLKGGQEPEPR